MSEQHPTDTPAIGADTSALPLTARLARGVRKALGVDRESRWNREYTEGGWDWLRNLDELAHHCVLAGYVSYLKPGGSVLDVGCGEGVFQEQLRGAAGRYLGVDFEAPIQKAAHKNNANTRFVVGDMNEFTTTERFDVIVFNESIYYLHETQKGLQRYEQFLTPDGVVLISMHGKERNDAIWAEVHARYTALDEVTMVNKRGVKWTTKALVPPNGQFTLPQQAP
ncbi:class I SAM-dependent methyltransferase [Gemmatimonas sp.]|uniref:class I SAM-dependent methyltransferase n=1 Tax=Gemmatimonas sp. TaxID=1962908 RepID=UPI003F727349